MQEREERKFKIDGDGDGDLNTFFWLKISFQFVWESTYIIIPQKNDGGDLNAFLIDKNFNLKERLTFIVIC